MEGKDVSLTISKEIVTPIVEAKLKGAILEALGGKDELIEKLINDILTRKVASNGKRSSYSSENKYTWIDLSLTNQIKKAIEEEVKAQLIGSSKTIKEALVAQLRTKSGSNKVAKALLDGLLGSFVSAWRSKIDVHLDPITED